MKSNTDLQGHRVGYNNITMARTKHTPVKGKTKEKPPAKSTYTSSRNVTKNQHEEAKLEDQNEDLQPDLEAPKSEASTSEEGKPNKPIPWANSKAKQLLRADLMEGRVKNHMPPGVVFRMHPEYAEYGIANFRSNLSTLREAMKRDYSRMVRDCEYYGNFVARLEEINAIDPPRPRDYPNWH